jgi:hypothetical protein
VWLVQEAAAWVYELVRHSPAIRDRGIRLPGYDGWPAFPQLNVHHRVALTNVVEQALGFRPIVTIPPPRGKTPKAGYSEAFPAYSWDLLADDKPLIDTFMGWVNQQREKIASQKKKGRKGSASHNRRELPKNIDWHWVEVLDHKKGQGDALTDTQRRRRTDARRYADHFQGPVISTIELADEEVNTVSRALLSAYPHSFGDLNSENFDLNELKALMGQFETFLFGAPIIGVQPLNSKGLVTSASKKFEDIIQRMKTGFGLAL